MLYNSLCITMLEDMKRKPHFLFHSGSLFYSDYMFKCIVTKNININIYLSPSSIYYSSSLATFSQSLIVLLYVVYQILKGFFLIAYQYYVFLSPKGHNNGNYLNC